MKSKIGFFQKFVTSLYNLKNYKIFLTESVGKSILYLLIISIIFSTFINIKSYLTFTKAIDEINSSIKSDVPNFNFENGELYVDGEMPIKFKDGDSTIIIDTSLEDSEVSDSLLDDYDSAILITKHTMIEKQYSSRIRETNFNDLTGIEFNNNTLDSLLNTVKIIVSIIIFGFCPFFSFIGKLFSVLTVMSLLALILFASFGKRLSYSKIINFSIYSLTVPIILNCINKIFLNISYFFLIYYFVGFIYLFFAIKYLPEEDTALDNTL